MDLVFCSTCVFLSIYLTDGEETSFILYVVDKGKSHYIYVCVTVPHRIHRYTR